jgi:exopolysaccharide biosynthesis protein
MVEPGHFVVITVDGRMSTYSRGVSVNTLMHMFYLYGCKQAYNLDGGNSTAMVFMGEHLNRHPGEPKSRTGQRSIPDMLMWGYSEQVPSVDDPVYHDSSPEE